MTFYQLSLDDVISQAPDDLLIKRLIIDMFQTIGYQVKNLIIYIHMYSLVT
jgi:hypothetical protein